MPISCASVKHTTKPSWSPQTHHALWKLLAAADSLPALFNRMSKYGGDISVSCRTNSLEAKFSGSLQATVAGESQNGPVMFIIFPASLIFIIECARQMIAGNLPKSQYGKQPRQPEPALGWISSAQYWCWQHSYTHFILWFPRFSEISVLNLSTLWYHDYKCPQSQSNMLIISDLFFT